MADAWLIHMTQNGVKTIFNAGTEQEALNFVGRVIIGERADIEVLNVYKVDGDAGTMTEKVAAFNDSFKLCFVEKGAEPTA